MVGRLEEMRGRYPAVVEDEKPAKPVHKPVRIPVDDPAAYRKSLAEKNRAARGMAPREEVVQEIAQRGGKRKGAGRKKAADPSEKKSVSLLRRHIAASEKLGGGNLSQGLRIALDGYFALECKGQQNPGTSRAPTTPAGAGGVPAGGEKKRVAIAAVRKP